MTVRAKITISGEEPSEPTLLDVSSFLYDINLLYQLERLALDPAYARYTFTWNVLRRNSRLLRSSDQLRVLSLRHESPVELVAAATVVASGAAAVWAFIQAIDRLAMLPMNRKKAELEIKKLERELAATALSQPPTDPRRIPGGRSVPGHQGPLEEAQAYTRPLVERDYEANLRQIESQGAAPFVAQVEDRLKYRTTIRIRTVEFEVEVVKEEARPKR